MLYAALPFYIYRLTGSTIATAGLIVANLLPKVLLGSVAGVFVDRWDRKHVMIVANLLQALAVAPLLLVRSAETIWVVYVVAIAQSSIASFFKPAETALLPSLVGDERLVSANALNALNNRLGRLLGLPLGGTLLGLSGLEAVVLVDGISFLLAAGVIRLMTAPVRPAENQPSIGGWMSTWAELWREWREGLGIVRKERAVMVLFMVLGVMTFGGTMLDPLLAPFVSDVLHAGPQTFGWLLSLHAVAGIVGGLVIGQLGHAYPPHALMGWGSIAAGAILLVQFNVPWLPLVASTFFLVGITSVTSAVGSQTLLQRSTPDAYRGRTFGALNATDGLCSLAGAGLGGVLAEVVGLVPTLNMAAGLTMLAGIIALLLLAPLGPSAQK